MTEPSAATVETWARLLRAQHAALSIVEGSLRDAKLPPLAWYDVLLELERVGSGGLRPFELQPRLLLPQYGLSRLLNRMAQVGYLEQLPCEDDGRGHLLSITLSGKNIRRRMWTVYGKAVQEAVGSKLTPTQVKNLSGLLKHLVR